ncbi:phage protein Gp36 family protein [Bacillus cereus group sp. IBL03679]|uniref:phage protein Gp36 family protein n=1 Tax=Bacillus cereus group sp. IBL03679 TaxID=3240095 RepID=UPI003D2F688E
MAYTTPTNIRTTVRDLSPNITDSEIQVFCEKATIYLDARLGSLYAVPFNPVPPMIKELATDLAGYYLGKWLYSSQKPNLDEKVANKFVEIKNTITEIIAGDMDIGVPLLNGKHSGFATTNNRDPIFNLDTEW